MFWKAHDPFRSGGSTQYRAFVFVHDAEQRRIAEATRNLLEVEEERKVRTPIRGAASFHAAEDYHQKYRLRRDALLRRAFETIYAEPTDLRDSTAAARVNGWLAGYGTRAEYLEVRDRLGLPEKALKQLDEHFAE